MTARPVLLDDVGDNQGIYGATLEHAARLSAFKVFDGVVSGKYLDRKSAFAYLSTFLC